jgi:drug/metabolite transporter (DMT)-like permease
LFFGAFALLVLLDTICQVGFKFAADRTAPATFDLVWLQRVLLEPWLHFVIVGYLMAFVTYMSLLRLAPVGPVFAASHLEIATVPLVGVVALGERLTLTQGLGCMAIVAGVAVLGVEQHRARQKAPPST